MFKLTEPRKETVKSFLVNAGTVFLTWLIVGPVVRPEGFNLRLFIVGGMLYVSVFVAAVAFKTKGKEREE